MKPTEGRKTKLITGKREDIINVAVSNGMSSEEANRRVNEMIAEHQAMKPTEAWRGKEKSVMYWVDGNGVLWEYKGTKKKQISWSIKGAGVLASIIYLVFWVTLAGYLLW